MKLAQLSIADLIALRQELHERILTCYKNEYYVNAGKMKSVTIRELRKMAFDYDQKFEAVKSELDNRIAMIEF
jgi:uncharacterized protein (UPF0305 family)